MTQTIDEFLPYLLSGDVSDKAQLYCLLSNLQAVPATQAMTWEQFEAAFDLVDSTKQGMMAPVDKVKVDSWLNFLDYGADPKGVSDSRPALVSALSDATSKNAGIWVPGGTYQLSASTNLEETTIIHGDPGRSIFQAAGAAPGDEFTLFKRAGQDCSLDFYGMVFRHNGQISATPVFADSLIIDLNQATAVRIDNCQFWNAPNGCISVRNEASGDLDINVTNSFGGTDIGGLIGALFLDVKRCNTMNIAGCLTDSIARSVSVELTTPTIHVAKNLMIANNTFRNGRPASISTTNTCIPIQLSGKTGELLENVTITGNTIDNCKHPTTAPNQGYAIRLEGKDDGTTFLQNASVTGNTILGWEGANSSHVIFLKSVKRFSVTGNVVAPPTWPAAADEAGLYLENCSDGVVNGNTFEGQYDPGVLQLNPNLGPNVNISVYSNTCQEDQVFAAGNAEGVYIQHRGKGDPEGVLAAAPGSIFQRSDGGPPLYQKVAGNFNTNWSAVTADRKSGVDTLAFNSTLVVDFDAGSFDNKQVLLTGDILDINLTATREGYYELRFVQDGAGFFQVFPNTANVSPEIISLPVNYPVGATTIWRLHYDGTTFLWG